MDIIKLNRNICGRSGKNLLRGMDGFGSIVSKFLLGVFYSSFHLLAFLLQHYSSERKLISGN